ncbi:MAG: 4Fe-4S binding protein [Clostridiales bacterium]|nr:4Fe-4S binding protein [Clostridiales bacterium]
MSTRFHSVRLDKDKCKGCTNCLKHCPTEAIRVRGGRARILDERCVDCGQCIRICQYHAKIAMTDPFDDIFKYKHRIAVPAPSLYGQFRHLENIGIVLDALISIDFDEVFEVARAADIATRAIQERLRLSDRPRPLISSACPTITRIIQVRFPSLIEHIINVRQPVEIAAAMARQEYARKHNVSPDEIGVFFITPCAAKMTAIRNPIGQAKSDIDGAISMADVFGRLVPHVTGAIQAKRVPTATPYGVGWANAGGEIHAATPRNSMSVDGVENVIRVLEEIEDGKLTDLDYFEGAACPGGCVGGPLTVEINYVAQNTIKTLRDALPEAHPSNAVSSAQMNAVPLHFDQKIEPNNAMRLDESIAGAIDRMEHMNAILERLPGYDCGACGSPTCESFAEDIVRGFCTEMDCIHLLKARLEEMALKVEDLAPDNPEPVRKPSAT